MKTRRGRVLEPFFYDPFKTWYQVHCIPISVGIALHYHDATEQRRSEEKQRATDERLRLALAASNGIGIWEWDVANGFV